MICRYASPRRLSNTSSRVHTDEEDGDEIGGDEEATNARLRRSFSTEAVRTLHWFTMPSNALRVRVRVLNASVICVGLRGNVQSARADVNGHRKL